MATNANAKTMAIVAEIFAAFPNKFRFTSGCRTPERNTAVGGVANSYHLTTRGCQAADFVPINGNFPASDKGAIGNIVAKHGYEVIVHNAGSGMHYHIEPNGTGVPVVNNNANNVSTATVTDQNSNTKTLLYIGLGVMAFLILRR